MTKGEELIKKIENCTVEEAVYGEVDKWEDELAELPEGKAFFNKRRNEQREALDELGRAIREEMKYYPES